MISPNGKNNSGRQGMDDILIEGLSRRVCNESKDRAARGAAKATGTGDHQESQGSHVLQEVTRRALSRSGLGLSQGVELKALDKVVRKDADLLPRTIRSILAGGYDIESGLTLELGDRLFLSPSASHELP